MTAVAGRGAGADLTVEAAAGRRWRDRKRYLWVAGLLVPVLPFAAEGWVERTGWAGMWWAGPDLDPGDRAGARHRSSAPTPRTRRSGRCPNWRTTAGTAGCTYLYLPLQYLGFFWGASVVASGELSPVSELGLALTVGTVAGVGINTAHELGHKRDSAGALAVEGRAGPDRLRPLLRRAQPGPPRQGVHARGPGQRPARRVVLGVPPPHGRGQPAVGVELERERAARARASGSGAAQRRAQRVGADGRAVRRR